MVKTAIVICLQVHQLGLGPGELMGVVHDLASRLVAHYHPYHWDSNWENFPPVPAGTGLVRVGKSGPVVPPAVRLKASCSVSSANTRRYLKLPPINVQDSGNNEPTHHVRLKFCSLSDQLLFRTCVRCVGAD